MTEHAVVIAGGGPTGLTLQASWRWRGSTSLLSSGAPNQDVAGSRSGGLHSRTIEVRDQRGIADRFLSQVQVAHVALSP